jgi:flagellar motor switch protein FliM
MDMSTSIGFFMIDRLLGEDRGTGTTSPANIRNRKLRFSNMFLIKLPHLQVAWCNYIDVEASLNSIETNSRLLQALAPEDIL